MDSGLFVDKSREEAREVRDLRLKAHQKAGYFKKEATFTLMLC